VTNDDIIAAVWGPGPDIKAGDIFTVESDMPELKNKDGTLRKLVASQ
jgi:hypothetical protein